MSTQMSDTFQQFERQVAEHIGTAQKMGMSDQDITQAAVRVGNWLSGHYDPNAKEHRVLKELWDAADDRDRQALARSLYRMIQRHQNIQQ